MSDPGMPGRVIDIYMICQILVCLVEILIRYDMSDAGMPGIDMI